jgi:hypothetical protein
MMLEASSHLCAVEVHTYTPHAAGNRLILLHFQYRAKPHSGKNLTQRRHTLVIALSICVSCTARQCAKALSPMHYSQGGGVELCPDDRTKSGL